MVGLDDTTDSPLCNGGMTKQYLWDVAAGIMISESGLSLSLSQKASPEGLLRQDVILRGRALG